MAKVDQKIIKRNRLSYEEYEASRVSSRKQDRSKQRKDKQRSKVSHCETMEA